MINGSYEEKVVRLARLKGIETDYRDVRGEIRSVPLKTLTKVLEALGCPIGSEEELDSVLAEEENIGADFFTETVLVLGQDRLPEALELHFFLPSAVARGEGLPPDLRVRMTIEEEGGRQVYHVLSPLNLSLLERVAINGKEKIRVGLPFPRELPLGYHRIHLFIEQGKRRFEQAIEVVIGPPRAFLPSCLKGEGKKAGLMISLPGLRSRNNWGIGDFGDLKALITWAVKRLKVGLIGLLPLHALANREPYNISPYYPLSRFYRNPIYLAVPLMEDYAESLTAQAMTEQEEVRHLLEDLRRSERVRFSEAARLKMAVLKEVFRHFFDHHWNRSGPMSPRKRAFMAYLEREGEGLDRFATYCALADFFQEGRPPLPTWKDWPIPFQDPCSPEVERFKADHEPEVLFHKYLQWQVEIQLTQVQEWAERQGAAIGLYHDLALGCDPWGADTWAFRTFHQEGFTVGAPPDDFAPQGQAWGFYPPKGEGYRRDGYRHFGREIQKNAFPGGALRIDHVMKFSRLFWIPDGFPAAEGVYVRYPLKEYLQVLALESVRQGTLIIGEDLGTVPPGFRETMREWGIFSYRLFYFEKDDQGRLLDPQAYPEEALAAVSTHDLPPLAGFWSMADIRLRRELGLIPDDRGLHLALAERLREKRKMIDRLRELGFLSEEAARELHGQKDPWVTEDLHRAVLSFIFHTRSKLAVVGLEDLFLVREQLNMPGTVDAYPNWSRKAPYTLEELWDHPEAQDKARLFRELVEDSGR